ncbi:putative oxidoreductase YcjS [Posidoniimonas polymericola]|uniref:Putative oxidoreductase YcjS n=1 Tax=Posidoniimonas polymericola TaxID=2528002 RepID=A0A5C5YTP4_9BACT|nr:Gfo/Idh/MocA family oxidoreductase [Posidoniimonas polymericola]TWT78384.1 putative oxidoreductase YcjS [Posidoniimonas polymericola]
MMRFGIIGAGAIGEKHAEAAESAGFQVAGVVDQDLEQANRLAAQHGAYAARGCARIWDDPSIQAVVIAVPNSLHRPLAIDAMRSGKDVLLEKPMGLTAGDCDELVSLAEDLGRILQVGYAHRFTSVGKAAMAHATSGELGELYHAKAHLHLRRGIPGLGKWFTTKSLSGGGVLIDVGVHLIDLATHLMGQPRTATVSGKAYSVFGVRMEDYVYESMWAGPPNYQGVFDVDDHATALITFENGATLDLQVAWACNLPQASAPDSMFALLGDRGGLSFELFGDHLNVRTDADGRLHEASVDLPDEDRLVLQLHDFARAVATRHYGVGATPWQARNVQAIVDLIYRSSETGQVAYA